MVLFNLAATGHMNPTLPLVTELVARGVPVSYFVQEKVRPVVEATGAKWYPLQDSWDRSETAPKNLFEMSKLVKHQRYSKV